MIDTHTHLNFQAFDHDWRQVVDRAISSGVTKMIVVGTDLDSSRKAVDMAASHRALYAAIGIHPHHAKQFLPISVLKDANKNPRGLNQSINHLSSFITHPKVVAVGEVGLDYHYYKNSTRYQLENTPEEIDQLKQIQHQLLIAQINLANQHHKPIIIHSRETKDDVLNILLKHNPHSGGVFHCFEGSKKYLRRILEAGFYISFTGNITHIPDRSSVAKLVPLDRLLLETDCPYMLPEPIRSQNTAPIDRSIGALPTRCEPQHVRHTAQHLARLHHISLDELAKHTTENANKLFSLKS